MVHTSHRACTPKIGSKNASDAGSNASDEWLQIADHSWVQCPHRWVGESSSDVGSNAPDGRTMIGPVADKVAGKIGRMTVTKGCHGAKYFGAQKKFRAVCLSDMWWRPTVWVRWTCVHSGWFAGEYRNFFIFSSTPTERRNVEFKVDIRHSFLGYEISHPYFSARAFIHVLGLDALDVGLQMWHVLHDTKDKKRHIGRRKA